MHIDTTSPTFRRLVAATLCSGLVLGVVACGDDDDTATADTTVTTAAPGDDHAGHDSSGDDADVVFSEAACDAWVDLNGAFANAPEDPAQLPAFGEQLVGIVGDLDAALPPNLVPAGQLLADAAQAVVDDGDPEQLFSPQSAQAQASIGAFAHEGCDLNAVDVTATEYHFAGLPDDLPAGRTSIHFVNDGTEEHEMVLFRRDDDSNASFEELTADGPGPLFEAATFAGVVFASPDQEAYTALDLEPGTYFMVCTIPTGGVEDAEPHLAHGMHQTVEVA
jgi:hypothetical protein